MQTPGGNASWQLTERTQHMTKKPEPQRAMTFNAPASLIKAFKSHARSCDKTMSQLLRDHMRQLTSQTSAK